MKLLWVPLFGSMFALSSLLWAPVAEAKFHKTLQEVAGNPGRSAECAKGDTKAVRHIVSNTIQHAKERFKLTGGLVNDTDTTRAEKEMYDFLNWKIGSPSAVCGQYITAGQKHFNKGYSDEAAAALLGLELPGAGRTEFKLPKKISDQLKAQIKSCADQVAAAVKGEAPAGTAAASQAPAGTSATDKLTAQAMEKVSTACQKQVARLREQLEKDYSIPAPLQDMAIKKISDAAVAGTKAVDRIGFNMPKKWDVETSVVEKLIAERRAERAAR